MRYHIVQVIRVCALRALKENKKKATQITPSNDSTCRASGVLKSCTLIRDKRACEQLISARSLLMIDEESLGKEGASIIASIVGDCRASIATATDLEDGLELGQAWMRVAS